LKTLCLTRFEDFYALHALVNVCTNIFCLPMLFKTVVLNTYFGNTYFLKNPQVSDLMKVHPVLAELFRVGRQTDRHDEANSRFLQFREPARNDCSSYFDITVGPRTAP